MRSLEDIVFGFEYNTALNAALIFREYGAPN